MSIKKLVRFTVPLVLSIVLVLGLTSASHALAIYNKTPQHKLFVVFTPNECTSFSLIPNIFCTEEVTIEPNQSWSSNNRGGSVTIGTAFHLLAEEHPNGLKFYGSGNRLTFDVDRQGWIEARPEYEAGKLSALVVDVFEQSGRRAHNTRVRVANYE